MKANEIIEGIEKYKETKIFKESYYMALEKLKEKKGW